MEKGFKKTKVRSRGHILCQGSYKKLQPFFKDFSRATLDFQGSPTRNIISQIVRTKMHISSLFF